MTKRRKRGLGLPPDTHLEDADLFFAKASRAYNDAAQSAITGACNNALHYILSGAHSQGKGDYALASARAPRANDPLGAGSAQEAFKEHCFPGSGFKNKRG